MHNNIHVFQNHLNQLRGFHFYFSTLSNLKKNLLVLGEFNYALNSDDTLYQSHRAEHSVLYISSMYVNHCRKVIAKIDHILKSQNSDFLIHNARLQGQNYVRQLENFKADVAKFSEYDSSLATEDGQDFIDRQSIVPIKFDRNNNESYNHTMTAFEMLDKFHHECCAISYLGLIDITDFHHDLPRAQQAPEPMTENPLQRNLSALQINLEQDAAQEALISALHHVRGGQSCIQRLAAHQSLKYIELTAALEPVRDYFIKREMEKRRASNV